MPHSASGPARLLRATDQLDCMNCHNGTNTQPAAPNIFAEMTNSSGVTKIAHPFPSAANPHDPMEPAVLNNNRHAGCVDCHNPHAAQAGGAFTAPPGVRLAQTSVTGVSGQDGMTALTPAANQYENCLALPWHQFGQGHDHDSELRIPSGTRRKFRRSAEPDSAVCSHGDVEPSGNARPLKCAGAAEPAAANAESGWDHRRTSHGHADLLHRLP